MAMRSHYCGLVTEALHGQTVSLCGWVNRRRDHGGVIFIDLRDREGQCQVVCDPDRPDMFKVAEEVRNEYCVQIKGVVRPRPDGTTNDNLKSGKIEVLCHELIVLNASVTPPFQIDDDNLSETTRLTHRVLDLRRPYMQNNLMLRYRVSMEVRKFLDANGFVDIETPMLTKSTPEGARDYLVPSRVHDGQFFALPQSPQLFKQLLMVAGYDRYYQITKCFRDEDLRADRQPEFTQIDIETSFLDEQEIRDMFQGMITTVFKNTIGVDLGTFPVMTYADAMHLYGSDKPDLRVKLQFSEVTDVMADVDFKVFSGAANMKGGRVVALRVPHGSVEGGGISRGEIDAYTEFVKIYGAKGLAYIRVNDLSKGRDGLQSPIVKNIHDTALNAVLERTGAQNGDLIFFGADKAKIVNDAIGALRIKIGHSDFGKKNGLFEDRWAPMWVVDFPMFEFDDEAQRYTATHHPFTAPKDGHEDWSLDWDRIAKNRHLVERPIAIADKSGQTLTDIRAFARQVGKKQPLGAIVVDYLQLMQDTERGRNRYESVTAISNGLKILARDLDVPVIALAQLNRGIEGRKDNAPGLSDLRDSGAIEQDADVVILLNREQAPGDAEDEKNMMILHVAKNRHGKTGHLALRFEGMFARVVENH